MSSLERRPGRVIFTRPGQTPGLHEGIYHGSLLATGLCALLMLVTDPFIGAMSAMLCGVAAMSMGLVAMSTRIAAGGRLIVVRRRFELVTPSVAAGYRDAPHEDEIEVEGHLFPKSKVREVVLGHYFNTTGAREHHFYPVYLVLDEHVIELAVLKDKAAALKLRRDMAELFEVPAQARETGLLGVGIGLGCVLGVVTITAELLCLMIPLFVLTTLGEFAAIPTPALMALMLWMINRVAARVFGGDVRKRIDEQVAQTFELGAKVRVDPSPESLDTETETLSEAPAEAEAEA